MPLVKILKDYQPKEGWKPGDLVDVSNADTLVKEGNAVLVDVDGKEIEHPDIIKKLREVVTTQEAIKLIGSLISRHPEKEKIIEALVDEGKVVKATPAVKANVKPIEEFKEEIVRPSVNVTPEEIKAKVEELKRKELESAK